MFRYLILGLLRDGSPRHGYALMKAHGERSGVHSGTGNFYRELQRLAAEGLVVRAIRTPPNADARRTPYQITGAGCVVFDAWLCEPGDLGEGQREDEISCRAMFLMESDHLEAVQALLNRWEEQLWVRGKVLERSRDTARSKGREVLALLLSRRMKYTAADVQFLGDFRSLYQRRTATDPIVRETEAEMSVRSMPVTPDRSTRPSRRRE